MQTVREYNSRIPRIKNVKFSGYYFYLNTNIQGDFQICISVPLTLALESNINKKSHPSLIFAENSVPQRTPRRYFKLTIHTCRACKSSVEENWYTCRTQA